MAEYIDRAVGYLELNNHAGVVCKLECYYKRGKDGECKRIGQTSNFPLGQKETLNLNGLGLDDSQEIWVTAYSNVKAGSDSHGNVWLRYGKGSDAIASYEITGITLSNKTNFKEVYVKNEYFDTPVNTITLSNDSGTVCSLNCYYKTDKDAEPKRAGSTSNIPVGQTVSLNLRDLDELKTITDKTVWVTAYADVVAGNNCGGAAWFPFKPLVKKSEAVFSISGVINFTSISLVKVYNSIDGILKGCAVQIGSSELDHSYVHACDNDGKVLVKYGCWGRDDGGHEVCSGEGDMEAADKIAGPNGTAGILYAITGVCHQTSNRILFPAHITVEGIGGYSISVAVYGVYGTSNFSPDDLTACSNDYFDELQRIQGKYMNANEDANAFIEKTTEELMLIYSEKVGKNANLNEELVRDIVTYANTERSKLVAQKNLSEAELKDKINELANRVAERFATIMSDEDYYKFVGLKKGEKVAIA